MTTHTNYSNHRFCRYHFRHAFYSRPLCFYSYRVPVTNVYFCGLRKSTIIHYMPCKRVIFNGLDWNLSNRFNFEKDFIFRKYSVCRSRNGWGKGRYRCMICDDYGFDDEAEVMFSRMTEEAGEECLDIRRRFGSRHNKVLVGERGHGAHQPATCGSGILRTSSKFECDSAVNKLRDKVDRTYEINEALLRRGHQRVKDRRGDEERLLKDEKDELLRESRKKEREDSLIVNHTQSAREERGGKVSRREGSKQRLRKDGSSCSSFYSLSSMGEYDSNNDNQERRDGFEEGLLSKYKRNSGRLKETEFDGKAETHESYQDEQRPVLKKGIMIEFDDLKFRKESEKKLTDMSTGETRFHRESYDHDGQKEKVASVVKSNEGRREHRMITNHQVMQKTETIKNFQEFKEHSEGYGANLTSSSNSQTTRNQRGSFSTTGSSLPKETRKEHYNKEGLVTREEEYKKSSKHAQSSKSQNLNISKTSRPGIICESTQKDQIKDSHTVLSTVHDAKEKHYHHSRVSTQIDSKKPSKQLTEEVDIKGATRIQKQSKHKSQKQEDSSNLIYGSYHESINNTQIDGVVKSDSKKTIKKKSNTSAGNSRGSRRNNADQWTRSKYDTVVAEQSSQPEARGDSNSGSRSRLAIEEVGHGSSREDSEHETNGGSRMDETYGQPLRYVSHEDAVASADLLQKLSSYHDGEFMEKVRHEMLNSEIQKKKKTHEMKMEHGFKQYEQQVVTEVTSGGSQLKEQASNSRHSSPSSHSKGFSVEMWDMDEPSKQENPVADVRDRNPAEQTPNFSHSSPSSESKVSSVEMWEVVGPSNQENPVAEVLDKNPTEQASKSSHSSPSSESKVSSVEMWDVVEPSNQENPVAEVLDRNPAGRDITEGSERSLWNRMSDIVRSRWASRTTNQSQISKSNGKNSPNQSTSSEACFSGNEPDEIIQEGDKNREGSISREFISVKVPSPAEVSSRDTPSGSYIPSLGEGTSRQQFEDIDSGVSMAGGFSKSPVIHLSRSPYIVSESAESSVSGNVDASGGGEILQSKLPVPPDVSETSQQEGKGAEQNPKTLLRKNQVVRDRFEEWEEAYKIEAEQRKMDEMFMREALLEAKKAADSWEVPVGAVLVHDGKIIARGHYLVEELRDSTAHAEMVCIREGSNLLRTWRLSETTLYVTLEPCAMCAGAILQARIDAIVWGTPNKLLGADGSWISLFPDGEGDNSLNPSDKAAAPVHPFHPTIQIRRNVLASECADSMQQFFQRRRKKEKKQEPPTSVPTSVPTSAPTSRFPFFKRPSKFLSKMPGVFHLMF